MFHNRLNVAQILCGALLIALASNRVDAEMIYISSDRGVSGSGTQLELSSKSFDGLGTFTDDLLTSNYVRDDDNAIVGSVSSTSSQTSTLTENQIRGLGRGSGFGSGPAEGIGESHMNVDFTISESTRFTLSGQLRLAPHGGSIGLNGSSAHVRLTGPDGVALEVIMDEDNPHDILGMVDFTAENQLSGIFPAGDYQLEAFSSGHGSSGATRCADFDFTLTALEVAAVPEPATFSLLALAGLAGLRIRRRCR